jgi:hypothetical protein
MIVKPFTASPRRYAKLGVPFDASQAQSSTFNANAFLVPTTTISSVLGQ